MIPSYQIARDRANLEGGWACTYGRPSEGWRLMPQALHVDLKRPQLPLRLMLGE
jgi:hypothetical protein